MTQYLTGQEKQELAKQFNLQKLKKDEQAIFYNLLFNHLNEFPILNEMARELIKKNNHPIKIKISELKNMGGYQLDSEIGFDKLYFHTLSDGRQGQKKLASTLWHEVLHYLQTKNLQNGVSKRGHIVHRQFIEAEAKSLSNLIYPRNEFEKKLYASAKERFSNKAEAEKFYLGISTKLRLHADREIAKKEAQHVMGKRFNERDWDDYNKNSMQQWQNYYYRYHAEHINKDGYCSNYSNKSSKDKSLINEIESYFFKKYGIHISVKSAISEEILRKYNMSDEINNTILVPFDNKSVFNIQNWRVMNFNNQQTAYVLDLPNMDQSYIQSLEELLKRNGVDAKANTIRHRDGSVTRCLFISPNNSDNVKRFEALCNVGGNNIHIHQNNNKQEKTPPMPPKPKKDIFLQKGETTKIDVYNPPMLCMGKKYGISYNLKQLFTNARIDFLKSGGIMVIGRNPASQNAKMPAEVLNSQRTIKLYQFPESDSFVSKIHGYFFMQKDGTVYYKDCSANGSRFSFNTNKNFYQKDFAASR